MTNEWAGKPFYFEDYRAGDSYRTISRVVDKDEVIAFASQWDPQPWHIDEAAAKASLFGGLTACSAHVFALFSIVTPQWENGAIHQHLAALGFDQMRMIKPLYAGDRIYCVSNIEMTRRSKSKPDRGIVTSRVEMVNQAGEVIFSLMATFIAAGDPGQGSTSN